MAFLIIEKGDRRGDSILLKEGVSIVIGREQSADICINDRLISRHHFRLKEFKGGYYIKDANSSNGTLLNDQPINQAKLTDGDRIQAGETLFSFVTSQSKEVEGLAGKTIGGYQILERIGRGGMGTVYRALQISLNREVALKLLSPELVKDTTFIERFKQEAQAAGQLNHPNIVQVFDVGSEGNLYFYSMEFVEEGSVQNLIKNGKWFPPEESLRVVMDAARGLAYAERKGIVHRDIKPDNLMIHEDGVIKIADLGLAKRTHEASTQEEGIFGTPHFISPEQAQGREVDIRSDIYSLGATFYRVLTGKTPFQGNKIREIIAKQIREEPPPIREVKRDIPEDMADLVIRMMKKNPDERFPSAVDLLNALEEIQKNHHYRLAKEGKKSWLTAAAFLLVIAILVAAFFIFQKKDPENQNKNAKNKEQMRQPANLAKKDAALKEALQQKDEAEARSLLYEVSAEVGKMSEGERISTSAENKLRAIWEKYPKTGAGTEAKNEADRVRALRDVREQKRLAEMTRQTEVVNRVEGEVEQLIVGDRFGGAYLLCNETIQGGNITEEDLIEKLKYLQGGVLQKAEIRIAFHRRKAETLEEQGKLEAARDVFSKNLAAFLPEKESEENCPPFFQNLRNICEGEIERLEEKILETLRILYRADLSLFYQNALQVEAALTRFDLESALQILEEQVNPENFKSEEYREHTERWQATISRGIRFLVTFVGRINQKNLHSLKFPLPSPFQGIESGTVESADISSIKLSYRYGKPRYRWSKYPADKYEELFSKRWDYTPEEQLGLASLFFAIRAFENAKNVLTSIPDSDDALIATQDQLLKDIESEEKAKILLEAGDTLLGKERFGEAKEKYVQLRREYSNTRLFLRNSSGDTHLPMGLADKLVKPN